MGIMESKSPLERRNTIARRSQRRAIHTVKSKVEKANQDVKKFKGVEEDENFNALLSELKYIETDLRRKSRDLQPQIRNVHDATLKRITEVVQALNDKLKDNQEKFRRKQEEQEEKARKKEEKENKKKKEDDDDDHANTNEQEEINEEAADLNENTEKRQTVELKVIHVIPSGEAAQINIEPEQNATKVTSPEEKRKSILKVGGVPVMPGAMLNELTHKSLRISTPDNDKQRKTDDMVPKINKIIENLQAIECQIADFVGRKNGTQYSRISDQLNGYLNELNQLSTNDEFITDQISMSKNYIGSCLNFLNDKAIDDTKYDSRDDVFLPDNNNVSPKQVQTKLQKLSKTTAI